MLAQSRKFISFAIVPACLVVSLGLSFLVAVLNSILPNFVSMLFFFGPQYLFSFSSVVSPVPGGFVALFSTSSYAALFGFLLWAITSFVFGFFTRKWRVGFQFIAAPIAIVLVAVLVHSAFAIFGYSVQLEGP